MLMLVTDISPPTRAILVSNSGVALETLARSDQHIAIPQSRSIFTLWPLQNEPNDLALTRKAGSAAFQVIPSSKKTDSVAAA